MGVKEPEGGSIGQASFDDATVATVVDKNEVPVAHTLITDVQSLENATIKGIETKNYTGKAVTQAPSITLGERFLKEGTDYTVSYENNVKVGTATMTITGAHHFEGSITKTFKIREVWVRRWGQNALDTMQAIAGEFGKASVAIVTTNADFKDALSIAPYSYATKSPILYAKTNKSLSSATLKYIKVSKFTKAIIVGGPVALPASIESQLTRSGGIKAANITRLAGGDSYGTSEIIAQWATNQLKPGYYGNYQDKPLAHVAFRPTSKLSANRLAVATSQSWKDALCGSALCGKNRSVLLLADSATAKSNWARACGFCSASKHSITRAYVFGGTSAVSAKVWDALLMSTAL